MKIKSRLFAFIGVVLIVTGCAHYSLVESTNDVEVGSGFMVDPVISWSRAKKEGIIIWTVDGPTLQQMLFFPGIEDGQPLFKPASEQEAAKMPLFRASMSFLEIMDLLEASFARQDLHQVKKENLQPVTFGGQEGFRFDFSYYSKAGLEYKGFAEGAVKDNKLYLIIYEGASLHYYGKYASTADKVIQSAKLM
jgi:hypothetical protein